MPQYLINAGCERRVKTKRYVDFHLLRHRLVDCFSIFRGGESAPNSCTVIRMARIIKISWKERNKKTNRIELTSIAKLAILIICSLYYA